MSIFEATHAGQYDQFHGKKDYRLECDLIEGAFLRYAKGKVRTLIDFGCGTGNHSILLAKRGYSVTGVDLSRDMLGLAREKALKEKVGIRWIEGDIRRVRARGPFDAALVMFSVLGYMAQNEDVASALGNVRRHLRFRGLLLFDVWYGPAVLAIKPSDGVKVVPIPGGKVVRTVTSKLDVRRHQCHVEYHLRRVKGRRVESETQEGHEVRYFFPMELELFLKQAGFALTSLTAFPTLDRQPDETSWNVLGVAHAI